MLVFGGVDSNDYTKLAWAILRLSISWALNHDAYHYNQNHEHLHNGRPHQQPHLSFRSTQPIYPLKYKIINVTSSPPGSPTSASLLVKMLIKSGKIKIYMVSLIQRFWEPAGQLEHPCFFSRSYNSSIQIQSSSLKAKRLETKLEMFALTQKL